MSGDASCRHPHVSMNTVDPKWIIQVPTGPAPQGPGAPAASTDNVSLTSTSEPRCGVPLASTILTSTILMNNWLFKNDKRLHHVSLLLPRPILHIPALPPSPSVRGSHLAVSCASLPTGMTSSSSIMSGWQHTFRSCIITLVRDTWLPQQERDWGRSGSRGGRMHFFYSIARLQRPEAETRWKWGGTKNARNEQ